MATNFGLLERNYEADALSPNRNVDLTQWERFEREVRTTLNREQSPGEQTRYKVLFLGRHGQGVHNVAERRYGTAEWDVSSPSSMLFESLDASTALRKDIGKHGQDRTFN